MTRGPVTTRKTVDERSVRRALRFLVALLGALITMPAAMNAQAGSVPVMSLVVDETRAAQRIVSVHEEITVQPGDLELAYPKWIPGEHGPTLPLTLRHADLPHHPGQVSLPGGGLDDGESAADAALREAHEEIGVAPADVRLIGPLSSLWVIVSNFVLFPFVGVMDHRPEFQPAAREVERLIEVPLADVRDPARVHWSRRDRDGVQVEYPYFDVAGHHVWGATAMVLSEFTALFD